MALEAMDTKPDETTHREEDDEPILKRKKTVTWADTDTPTDRYMLDIEANDIHTRPPEHTKPAAHIILRSDRDPLFQTLNESLIFSLDDSEHDTTVKQGDPTNTISPDQLFQRRINQYDSLLQYYEDELWSVGNEMLLRKWKLSTARHDAHTGVFPDTNLGKFSTFFSSSNTKERIDDIMNNVLPQGGLKQAWHSITRALHGDLNTQKITGETNQHNTNAQALQQQQQHLDHHPSPEDIEEVVSRLPPLTDEQAQKLQHFVVQQRNAFIQRMPSPSRLESSAMIALSRELDAHDAVAALNGRAVRYLLRRTAVVLGRASAPGGDVVDVDLTREASGAEKAVSRQQAQLFLDLDRQWKIRCLGRRAVYVNGEEVKQGEVAVVTHMSLIKAGPVVLMFVVNRNAVERIQRRSMALNVC